MRTARVLPGLVAGLLLFDLLLNLPGFSLSSPLASLLLPTIDLLVITAACMGAAQAGEDARLPLRIAVSALAVVLAACSAGLRFGFDIAPRLFGAGSTVSFAAGCVVSFGILAGAGVLSFLLTGLLIGGLQPPIIRSVMLLVIALAAVLQVVNGRRLFGASVIPRLVALVGSQAR
jgi:hypothetical protein